VKVLDEGYIEYVESWGSDERIIEAARMSTNKGFQGWDTDARLLSYLWHNKHLSPFEMAGLVVEVQAPIFVFREWHRHRTQSYNELSARYTELPNLYYVPTIDRLMNGKQSSSNRQGSDDGFDQGTARRFQQDIVYAYEQVRRIYESLLRAGVAKELARVITPVGQYSRMRASANLRNWLQFLELRLPGNVQWETRSYAEAVANIVEERFPRTYALFRESMDGRS